MTSKVIQNDLEAWLASYNNSGDYVLNSGIYEIGTGSDNATRIVNLLYDDPHPAQTIENTYTVTATIKGVG